MSGMKEMRQMIQQASAIRRFPGEDKSSLKQKAKRYERQRCGECGVLEGQYHKDYCDVETCGMCGLSVSSIGCDCSEKAMIRGLRVPFVSRPLMCARCGKLWPNFFMRPGWEWHQYVYPDAMLCQDCYELIKDWIKEEGTEMYLFSKRNWPCK
jgi:hypothetical protein